MNGFPTPTRRLARLHAVAVAIACAIAATTLTAAPPPARPARVGVGPATNAGTSVMGVAWNVDNTPLGGVTVRLRNLTTGKAEATAVADSVGQFSFAHIEGGTYVVELLGENGKVVTVGQAFVIGQGETVATFVRLGTKVPWFTGFFQNAASAAVSTGAVFENASSAVMSAAGALGITPLAPVQQCVSPPCN